MRFDDLIVIDAKDFAIEGAPRTALARRGRSVSHTRIFETLGVCWSERIVFAGKNSFFRPEQDPAIVGVKWSEGSDELPANGDILLLQFSANEMEESAIHEGQPNFSGQGAVTDRLQLRGLAGLDWFENSFDAARQAAGFRADPKATGLIFPNAHHAAGFESGRVVGIKNSETHAVEAYEAIEGRQPKIAVVRLGHRNDGILWKALIGLPGIDEITAGALVRKQHACAGEPGNQRKRRKT